MTTLQALTASRYCFDTLGFLVDEDDKVLYKLMHSATSRSWTRAVNSVADAPGIVSTVDYHNMLIATLSTLPKRPIRPGKWVNAQMPK